jgi:hypothetical protein
MKYIITENTLKNSIEKYLKQTFPEIISVVFNTKKVYLASGEDKTILRNVIEIVVDPFNIMSGNPEKYERKKIRELKSEIWESLDTMFSLGFSEYGSDWEMKLLMIKLEEI